jgi:hypothetical protein
MTVLKEEIARLYAAYRAELPESINWEDEADRWHELVLYILDETTDLPLPELRRIVTAFATLGFLQPEAFSSDGGAEEIAELLQKNGVKSEDARRSSNAIRTTAQNIKKHKTLQAFVRDEGEKIVKKVAESILPSDLDATLARRIAVSWGQSALELPVLLSDEHVQRFCKAMKCTETQLVETADDLNVSVAILDELIQLSEANDKNAIQHNVPRLSATGD